jgi:hypothetical protein
MDSVIKRNCLVELTDITDEERDSFLQYIRNPLIHDDVNPDSGRVCAMVSLVFQKSRELRETVNMRVSKVSIMKKIYSSTTNHNLFACLLFV